MPGDTLIDRFPFAVTTRSTRPISGMLFQGRVLQGRAPAGVAP
jgi:hypothetical protein